MKTFNLNFYVAHGRDQIPLLSRSFTKAMFVLFLNIICFVHWPKTSFLNNKFEKIQNNAVRLALGYCRSTSPIN